MRRFLIVAVLVGCGSDPEGLGAIDGDAGQDVRGQDVRADVGTDVLDAAAEPEVDAPDPYVGHPVGEWWGLCVNNESCRPLIFTQGDAGFGPENSAYCVPEDEEQQDSYRYTLEDGGTWTGSPLHCTFNCRAVVQNPVSDLTLTELCESFGGTCTYAENGAFNPVFCEPAAD